MRYVSVCAGIEAATVAWHPLGWEPVLFAEIEPFPRAVLAHHYPSVPLVGDFTELIFNPPVADLLVGGTPCQAFSVAGKRLSLEDYRGNLSLAFADLFHAGQYRWAVWENVPGVLSTKDNAFGSLLGRLVGADTPLLPHRGGKWTNAGVVSGPQAVAAWRVLDAQYFGVAQRRRRVFVCVSRGAGNWAAAAALLPVGESVSGHPPTRRQAGEGVAGIAIKGAAIGRQPHNGPQHGEVKTVPSVFTLNRTEVHAILEGGGEWPAKLAPTLNAHFGEKQGLEDQHINGGAGMFVLDKQGGQVTEGVSPTPTTDLAHRMGPVVPVPQDLRNREGKPGGGKGPLISENQSLTLATNNDQVVFAVQNPTLEKAQNGLGVSEGPMYTLESSRPHGVAFASPVAPTVSQEPPFSGTGIERVEAEALVVAAFDPVNITSKANRTRVEEGLPSPTLHSQGMSAVVNLRPRRLTPNECEKLQAFPVGYTNIPWRLHQLAQKNGISYEEILLREGKSLREPAGEECPDGPRYKALGNSMCVNVMAWIGKRIQCVEES